MKKTLTIWLILFLPFGFTNCQQNKLTTKAAQEIPTGSMKQAGMDSILLRMIDTAVINGTYPNIHSLLIARNNKLIYEKYWPGKDEKWATDIGIAVHEKDSLHDIRSISKSVVSACIGIALQQGKIKNVNQKVFDFFPEYSKYDSGLKSLLTIQHLLSMTSGLIWNEEVPYTNPQNSEVRMIYSGNPIEYVLSQPMDVEPGKRWKYNGGTTQLLAEIIEKTTGKRIDKFAEEYLFKPLGINRYEWFLYPETDIPAAASGLRLRSRDLLKFGLLYFNKGSWNNQQIVPAEWVEMSFRPQIKMSNVVSYGYQFWLFDDTVMNKPVHVIACVGNGDQRILMDKENNLVIVATAGNYNIWNIENDVNELARNYIYPALSDW
ncbi:MAG TPA: serine hydrolase [Bacteroidales bacterium]|nr:serine hydrolase [Bacteroidales bacterium]